MIQGFGTAAGYAPNARVLHLTAALAADLADSARLLPRFVGSDFRQPLLHLAANTYCAGRWFSSGISGAIGPSVRAADGDASAASGVADRGVGRVGS